MDIEADMLINKDKIESTEVSRTFEGKKGLDEFKKTAKYLDCGDMEQMVKTRGTFINELLKVNMQSEITDKYV